VLRGRAPESLLESYESERQPVAERNGEESRSNYEKIFEVVEAFGLDRDAPELMARLDNHRFLRAMPGWLRRPLRRILRAPGHLMLSRFRWSPRVRKRVLSSIADQRGHFDRIGLDIGYIYEKGAVATEPHEDAAFEQRVMDYEPTTRPGARFPHVELRQNGQVASSHDLLDYSRYTLLAAKAGAWMDALEVLAAGLESEVRAIAMDEIDADAESVGRLRAVCELGTGGALLIRPDGHVAWRHRGGSSDPSEILKQALEEIGVR
jgi:2,4-dichlorophenol 6-monooxygenase